jgi:hypothetical protein
METHSYTDSQLTAAERRRYPRTLSHTTATLRHGLQRGAYEVRNLSVDGALVARGPRLEVGTAVRAELHLPLYPDVEIAATVVRCAIDDDGEICFGLQFHHRSDVTEDHIQSALLSELERSQTHGIIADLD